MADSKLAIRSLPLLATCVVLVAFNLVHGAQPSSASTSSIASLHFVIPGAAGGGWDRTARAVGEALTKAQLVTYASFENMSGGGGAKGIAHTIEAGDPELLLVNSTPIVVRSIQNVLPQTFRDLTPIASIIGDYSVLAVRTQSKYQTTQQFIADLTQHPRAIAIGGGSVFGGTDHIFAGLFAKSFSIKPSDVKYIPYDAGGKAMAGLLSGEVQVLSSGYGEVVDLVEQDWVRILCIAAPRRLSRAPTTPTCDEDGAPGLEFVNWRGFFAAPSLDPGQIQKLRQVLTQMMSTTAWHEIRQRYGWVDLFNVGADFSNLLDEQEVMLKTLLTQLKLLEA